METHNHKYVSLMDSPEYAAAEASYSNAFKNGAGRQRPGTVGFALWLIYDNFRKENGNKPPSAKIAAELAKAHGLNTTSAVNALGKWAAYHDFRRRRQGAYAEGPRS